MPFTDRYLRTLTPGTKRYARTEPGGLTIRVNPSGKKSWYYFYKADGKPRWLYLGTYLEAGALKVTMSLKRAREELSKAKAQRAEGEDPAEAKARAKEEAKGTATVAEFAETYIERWAKPNKKSWAEDQRILKKEVLPALGDRKLPEVARREIVLLVDTVRGRGAEVQANRTLAVVRRMFNFAVERGELEYSPATHIKASREKARDRILSREEIRRLFQELEGMNLWPATRYALELILRTAQRPGEVRAMEWADLDWDREAWIIPAEKAKNEQAQVVPLPPKSLAILREIWESSTSRWVLPATRGDVPISKYTVAKALQAAINPAERSGGDPDAQPLMERATPHDLRRTAATLITELGFNRLVVDKLLNHKDSTVGGVYDRHSYDKEKRQALEAWERDLEATFCGTNQRAEVVELPTAR